MIYQIVAVWAMLYRHCQLLFGNTAEMFVIILLCFVFAQSGRQTNRIIIRRNGYQSTVKSLVVENRELALLFLTLCRFSLNQFVNKNPIPKFSPF